MSSNEDLSPEGINRIHGKPVWKCWGCKAETGLHWHFGLSVAICLKPECAQAYNDMCATQLKEEEEFAAYCKENF